MQTLFDDHLLRALSWTFIHSLWQGLVLTVMAGLVMLLTRRSTPALRYAFLCMLFFLFLGGVVISFLLEWNTARSSEQVSQTVDGTRPLFNLSSLGLWIENLSNFFNRNASWIVLAWVMILAIKLVRMIRDIQVIHRLRSQKTFEPGDIWEDKFQSLKHALGIHKKVSLAESALVKVPLVIGHFKPLILVPIGILNHMPPREVEAVLLHELAHIRRHDYLVNFIQRITELLFFFNPGLLWVSSLLRVERENCCDDLAISLTQNKVEFVEALIRFKEYSLKPPAYALGLFTKKSLLLQRVTRMATNCNKGLSSVESGFFILSLLALILFLSGMRQSDRLVKTMADAFPTKNIYPVALPSSAPDLVVPDKRERKKRDKPVQTERAVRISSSDEIQQRRASLSASPKKVSEEVFDYRLAPLTLDNSNLEPESVNETLAGREEIEAMRVQAEKDKQQAERDREQAIKDRVQADRDREQAIKDRAQAEKDRQQAERDREQARKDREQAMRDLEEHKDQ